MSRHLISVEIDRNVAERIVKVLNSMGFTEGYFKELLDAIDEAIGVDDA